VTVMGRPAGVTVMGRPAGVTERARTGVTGWR